MQDSLDEIYEISSVKNTIVNGFMRDRSIITNAKLHLRKKYVINIDIEDFFGSINYGRIQGYFTKNRYFKLNAEIASIISSLVCFKSVLPQGSPVSPVISNLIFQSTDMRILTLAKKYSLTYSRYADDLSFSTNKEINSKDFIEKLEALIERSGFKINHSKTRVQSSSERQEVTGLTVNKRLTISKKYYKKSRSMVHSLVTNDNFHFGDVRDKKEIALGSKINILQGIIGYIDSIDLVEKNEQIKKLASEADQIKLLRNLTKREKSYRDFWVYKKFFFECSPLIICEGPTDITHINLAILHVKKIIQGFIKKIMALL